MSARTFAGLLAAAAFSPPNVMAAEPALTHAHPAAVQRGVETEVKLAGKFDPWPCQVWCGAPGVRFTPGKDAGVYQVLADAAIPPGPVLIRAWNQDGTSAPIALMVEERPQTAEVEPNDDFRSPQVVSGSRVTVNGNHPKNGDVDTFAMDLKAGQEWVVWVEAYVLAAGFDAMLRITDSSGRGLAFNHDGPRNMDPFLVFKVPADGRYLVQTMGHKYPASTELDFAGGADCVYRLHLSTEPFVRNTLPLAVQRGVKSKVKLEGWNLGSEPREVEVEGKEGEKTSEGFPLAWSDIPEFTASPEDGTASVVREIPFGVSGRLAADGKEQMFRFRGVKDGKLTFRVESARWGSELDGWLQIRTPDGKELAANDDGVAGSNEPELAWTVPADGEYLVAVGDLTQRGGDEFFYRLVAQAEGADKPKVSGSVAWHTAKMEAGKPAELKVDVALQPATATATAVPDVGFVEKPEFEIAAVGLPTGIVMPNVEVPEKGGAVTVVFKESPPAADAVKDPAGKAAAVQGPFRLVVRNRKSGEEFPVSHPLISIGENNGVPTGYRELLIPRTDWLWIFLPPPPPPPPPAPAAEEVKK